jgi:hypothetical protein
MASSKAWETGESPLFTSGEVVDQSFDTVEAGHQQGALALLVLAAAVLWDIDVFSLPGVAVLGIDQGETDEIAVAFLLVIPAFFIDRALRVEEASAWLDISKGWSADRLAYESQEIGFPTPGRRVRSGIRLKVGDG